MKTILLINPTNKSHVLSTVPAFRLPPLNLLYLQHLTNRNRYVIDMCDENVDDLQTYLCRSYDLVAITSLTSNAPRAYQIANLFRKVGTPVIMGGIHVSMLPDEAINYADSVVIGEAEKIWQKVLNDFENNELKKKYVGGLVQPSDIPVLKDSDRERNYFMPNLLQTARGCPVGCEFCSVTKFHGSGFRARPISNVMEEIRHLKGHVLIFADDNILGYGKRAETRAKRLFKALIEQDVNMKWGSQVSINIGTNEGLLRMAAKSGAKGFFIGIESLNQKVLERMGKYSNLKVEIKRFREIIRRIHDHGIAVLGGFILGNDDDDQDIFQRTTEFVIESELDAVQYSIATPMPGTRFFERLSQEGRIIYKKFPDDWRYFDGFHVTFTPRKFDPDELIEQVSKMYSLTNKPLPAVKRTFKSLVVTKYFTGSVYLLGFNLGCRKGFSAVNRKT